MIQNPNIKFLDKAIISLEDTSPNSHFFPTKNQSQKLDSRFGKNKTTYGSFGKTNHNLVIEVRFG